MIKVDKDIFSAALGAVSMSCSKSSTLPVLHNVKIKAENDVVELTTTDLAHATKVKIGANVEDPFETTVPLGMLTRLVSGRTAGELKLSFDVGEVVILRQGRWYSKLKGIPADEFPLIKEADNVHAHWTQPTSELLEMLGKVAFCAASDDTRPILTGVNVQGFKDSHMVLAATDGFRLGKIKSLTAQPSDQIDTIISASVIRVLSRVVSGVGDSEEDITVSITDSQVIFAGESWSIYSQLIMGNYPDISPFMNVPDKHAVVVDWTDLTNALKSALVFANESGNTVRITPDSDRIDIESEATEYGESKEGIPAQITGIMPVVALNGVYLNDVASVNKNETLKMMAADSNTPVFIQRENDDSGMWIIMPMHFRN